jgi:hypothetical protein
VSKASKASKNEGLTETNSVVPGALFVKDDRWAKTFIPTITHAFYMTRDPFLDWSPESAIFLATVQCAFNLSFPNVVYTVSARDRVAVTVRAYYFLANYCLQS